MLTADFMRHFKMFSDDGEVFSEDSSGSTYFQRLKVVIWEISSTAILAMKISKVSALACPIIFSGREDGTKKTTVFFNSKVVLQGICEILPPLPIILISSLINY